MSIVTISLSKQDPLSVDVLRVDDGRRFIAIRLGASSVYLDGFDAECVEKARQFARLLVDAAAEVGAALEAQEPQP